MTISGTLGCLVNLNKMVSDTIISACRQISTFRWDSAESMYPNLMECNARTVLMCSDCQSGQFRLVDERSHNEGRLEVCVGGQWRGVSTTSLSNITAGDICTRLGFSADGELNVIYVRHNFAKLLSEPTCTVMSFEPTRGDVYCCNTELHCTQCNQTMSVGLNCSQYSTTTMIPVTPPSSVTTASTTETTTAQQEQTSVQAGAVLMPLAMICFRSKV